MPDGKTRKPSFRQKSVALLFAAGCFLVSKPVQAMDFTDEEVIRGFNLTVFGSEYSRLGFQTGYAHKFRGPVLFEIHDMAAKSRSAQAERFIRSLNSKIRGLKTRVVTTGGNFELYIVDSKDYKRIVAEKIDRKSSTRIASKCLVKTTFSRRGNIRSTAVIVSDAGDALFNRCLIEEILQGLGPLNEDASLTKSVFNDRSKLNAFTKFDRYILNMLYDERIKNGARRSQTEKVIHEVLQDVRRRIP